jgi:hypothetical protein
MVGEIERICGENTLASQDKSRLEMEPDQPPTGKWFAESTSLAPTTSPFRELSESAELLDVVREGHWAGHSFHYSKTSLYEL